MTLNLIRTAIELKRNSLISIAKNPFSDNCHITHHKTYVLHLLQNDKQQYKQNGKYKSEKLERTQKKLQTT